MTYFGLFLVFAISMIVMLVGRCEIYFLCLFQTGAYTLEKEKAGQAMCPYDPNHNSTAIFVGKSKMTN